MRTAAFFDRNPWARYALGLAAAGGIGARGGFVLATYPPHSSSAWTAFVVALVIVLALTLLVALIGKAPRSRWIVPVVLLIILMVFAFAEGLGWSRSGNIDLATENPVMRSFALGAALGLVPLLPLGGHLAARAAARKRSSQSGFSSDGSTDYGTGSTQPRI